MKLSTSTTHQENTNAQAAILGHDVVGFARVGVR
jgi:hypothetical protein